MNDDDGIGVWYYTIRVLSSAKKISQIANGFWPGTPWKEKIRDDRSHILTPGPLGIKLFMLYVIRIIHTIVPFFEVCTSHHSCSDIINVMYILLQYGRVWYCTILVTTYLYVLQYTIWMPTGGWILNIHHRARGRHSDPPSSVVDDPVPTVSLYFVLTFR